MHYIRVVANVLEFCIGFLNRDIKTDILQDRHVEEATEMLSAEFCKREPLCRHLGLQQDDIRGFFRDQLHHVVRNRLGVVACDRQGRLRGVVTIEDHFDQFQPESDNLHPGLQYIGLYLESIELPSDILERNRGELYHCALAAVAKGKGQSQVLSLLFLKINRHLKKMGYKRGYAKVTNPGIIKRFRRLEKYAFSQVFTPKVIAEPAKFSWNGQRPFLGFKGVTSLFSWPMH